MAASVGSMLEAFPRKFNDEINRSVWFLDADRTREAALAPSAGGGGRKAPDAEPGLSVKNCCERSNGDRPF